MTTILPKRRSRMPLWRLAKLGALALLVLAALMWRAPLASALWSAWAPLVAWRDSLSVSQVATLRAELASTTAALADRDALYAENQLLKQELGRGDVQGGVLALILERPPGVPYDTFVIDIGQNHGVAAGQLVLAGGTTAIGQVSEAYATEARVTLFSSPGSSFQGLIRGTIPISIEGQGAGSMKGEVPSQTVVHTGDPVLFPDLSGGFAASVSRVDTSSQSSFETVYMQLPVDLFSLRYVLVKTAP